MFKVKCKYDVKGKPEAVYAVKRFDDGETYFLMYNFGEWDWRNSNIYEPWEE